MKKMYVLLFGLFLSVGFVNISYAAEGDAWITPANQNVQTNEDFTFNVYFDSGSEDLGSFNMYFDFDPAKVTVNTAVGTDGFDKGSSTLNYTMIANAEDLANGHYRFAGINGGDANIASGNNIHLITIHAKATSGFTSGTSNIEIRLNEASNELGQDINTGNITNAIITFEAVNVAPEIISNGGNSSASVNAQENQKSVTTVVATDSSAITYSISGGADQAKFTINSVTGILEFVSAPDFEVKGDANSDGDYEVQVKASDGSLFDTQDITVTVTDVSENGVPVIATNGGGVNASVSVMENQIEVTTVSATDSNSEDTLTYYISGGADQSKFRVHSSQGTLTFKTAPDFEVKSDANSDGIYEVQVSVSDGALTDTQNLFVTVSDMVENGYPVIYSDGGEDTASIIIDENKVVVTTVSALDSDVTDVLKYSISGGLDKNLFVIDSSTGVLKFYSAPNFEEPLDSDTNNTYEVQVTVSDSQLTDVQSINVTVINIIETGNPIPMYRLFNTKTGAQLYTRGKEDRDKILAKWSEFEFTDNGPAFYAAGPSDINDLTPIYRLYNTRTGVHLYTRGAEDRDKILAKWSDFEFTDGVPAFYASLTDDGTTPIYRLYNTRTGVHLYTRGAGDRDKVLSKWSDFEFTDGKAAFYANMSL